jgi:hypothetical protein
VSRRHGPATGAPGDDQRAHAETGQRQHRRGHVHGFAPAGGHPEQGEVARHDTCEDVVKTEEGDGFHGPRGRDEQHDGDVQGSARAVLGLCLLFHDRPGMIVTHGAPW